MGKLKLDMVNKPDKKKENKDIKYQTLVKQINMF